MSCSADRCSGNQRIPYECNRCGQQFCTQHRLPENHNCPSLSDSGNTSAGQWFSSNSKRSQRSSSNSGTESSRLKNVMLFGILAVLVSAGIGVAVSPTTMGDLAPGQATAPTNETVNETATGSDSESDSGFFGSLFGEELNETELEKLVHQEMNEYRRDNGADALAYDTELAVIAEYHSDDMASKGFIFHTSPAGESFEDRYEMYEYDCRVPTNGDTYLTGGENVLKTYYRAELTSDEFYSNPEELAEGIVNQFVGSERHRENLMKSAWRREAIGINVTEEDHETAVYVTQNFC